VALVSRSDHKRTADVKALCTCELFELSREDVTAIIKIFPVLEARLQSMAEVCAGCLCDGVLFVYVTVYVPVGTRTLIGQQEV